MWCAGKSVIDQSWWSVRSLSEQSWDRAHRRREAAKRRRPPAGPDRACGRLRLGHDWWTIQTRHDRDRHTAAKNCPEQKQTPRHSSERNCWQGPSAAPEWMFSVELLQQFKPIWRSQKGRVNSYRVKQAWTMMTIWMVGSGAYTNIWFHLWDDSANWWRCTRRQQPKPGGAIVR